MEWLSTFNAVDSTIDSMHCKMVRHSRATLKSSLWFGPQERCWRHLCARLWPPTCRAKQVPYARTWILSSDVVLSVKLAASRYFNSAFNARFEWTDRFHCNDFNWWIICCFFGGYSSLVTYLLNLYGESGRLDYGKHWRWSSCTSNGGRARPVPRRWLLLWSGISTWFSNTPWSFNKASHVRLFSSSYYLVVRKEWARTTKRAKMAKFIVTKLEEVQAVHCKGLL